MTMLDLNTLDAPLHEQINKLRKAADADTPPDVRDYYDGRQPVVATPDQMQALGPRAERAYIENVLKQCTDTMAGRLIFRRFLCEDGPSEQDWLEAFARRNQFGEHVITNTVRILVDGNNALSLSWNVDEKGVGRPVVHQEPWWDGKEGIFVEVADDGQEQWAVKEWIDLEKRRRRTVYLPDRIMRFVQVGGDGAGGTVDESAQWQTYPDDEQFLVWWTRNGQEGGEPLGVPVVHFGNTVTADRLYGASVIEPLLGLQDALNGTIFDIVAAQAMNAFGIYTATGVDQNDTELSVGPGRLWKAQSADAQFGLLNGSEMGPILDGYRAIRAAIANQFPVSEHLITGGQWPSGMALQRAEGPMISMVKLLGETCAPSYVRVAHRAMELENAFGGGVLNEDHMIQVEYAPAEQLDEGAVMEIERERVGLYADLARLPRVLMLKTGLIDETEANEILAEQEAQRDAFVTNLNAGAFGQDYDENVA